MKEGTTVYRDRHGAKHCMATTEYKKRLGNYDEVCEQYSEHVERLQIIIDARRLALYSVKRSDKPRASVIADGLWALYIELKGRHPEKDDFFLV